MPNTYSPCKRKLTIVFFSKQVLFLFLRHKIQISGKNLQISQIQENKSKTADGIEKIGPPS